MPLRHLRRKLEPGLPPNKNDVRQFGLNLPEKEKNSELYDHYPTEFSYTEEELQSWIMEYNKWALQGHWHACIRIASSLKVINPECIPTLIKPSHRPAMQNYIRNCWDEKNNSFSMVDTFMIGQYCYLFTEAPEQIFAKNVLKLKTSLSEMLIRMSKGSFDINTFSLAFFWGKFIFSDIVNAEELERFRAYICKYLKSDQAWGEVVLNCLVCLRVLFPDHPESLECLERYQSLKKSDITSINMCRAVAAAKIIAAPRILGITNDPAKNNNLTQAVANTPEIPLQREI